MPEFTVHDLQAADPDGFLALPDGVRLHVHDELDAMGMSVVDVSASSRERLLDFVRYHWGDEDKDWFANYVEARVVASGEPARLPRPGRSVFGRSVEGSAGTIVLLNGRTMQGWVTELSGDSLFFVYREEGDNPGCGREITVDAPGDVSRTAVVRVAAIAAYEFAGEDGW